MIPIRSSVQVKSLEHTRAGEAGVIVAHGTITEGDEAGTPCAIVRFDADQPDQADEAVRFADLALLTGN